jgi:hypothetical protein
MSDEISAGLLRQVREIKATLERLNARDGKRSSKRTALPILSSVITATSSYHSLLPETGTSDDLVTINATSDGYILCLKVENSGDTITAKNGIGNLKLNGDFVMNNIYATLMIIYDATLSLWLELSRKA